MTDPHLELLATVASWYYEDDVDQATIAECIQRSRSMVSRLLREAKERGLVDVKVRWPLRREVSIEQELCQKYGISEAWVLAAASTDYRTMLRGLGELGATCLRNYLKDGGMVGLGWGRTLHEVVRAMPVLPSQSGTVVQIIGALGHGDPVVEGAELVRWLASKIGFDYRFVSAPVIVDSESTALALFKERMIAEVLQLGKQVDVALLGLGAIEPGTSGLYRTGYVTHDEATSMMLSGNVGDILARHVDQNGNIADVSLNGRVIGQDLESLKQIPTVITVAGGETKVQVISAALKGGYIDILVTDYETARRVLRTK